MNKSLYKLILVWVIVAFAFLINNGASAATSLPSSVYLDQKTDYTCTLASAAMMLRARAYLSGYDPWNTITENAIKSQAWTDENGLKGRFTYYFDNNSISVTFGGGVSLGSIKSLIDAHPEGIVLFCGGIPHAVFITDYEDDTIYCADPAAYSWSSVSSGRIPLGQSSLAKYSGYGSQSLILNNTTKYWYVSAFSITPTCSHNTSGNRNYTMYNSEGRCPECGAWKLNDNDNATCTTGIYQVVSGKTAYLRVHPYKASNETINELLASPSAGTRVVVTGAVVNGFGNLWYKVLYAGYEGYIVGDSLQLVEAVEYIVPNFDDLPSRESIGQTTATMAKTISVSGTSISSVSTVGMVLYNASNTALYEKEETPTAENGAINAWYEIGSGKEINYPLSPGTTYKYRFFVVLSGETERRYSGLFSFTTIGTPSTPTHNAPSITVSSFGPYADVTWDDVGASSYYVYVQNKATGSIPYGNNMGKDCSIHFELAEGNYDVYVTAVYSADVMVSGSASFKTERLRASIDRGMEGTYRADESVIMSLNSTNFETCSLVIYRTPNGGETYKYWEYPINTANYTLSFPHEGYYSCCFTVTKGGYTIASDWVAWSVINQTYSIYYDANGGSDAPSSQVKTHNTALTLSSTVPKRTGYTFQGWGTSASATSATYPAGGSYTANAAATLYAVWKPISYTVSLNANGGAIGQDSISVTYGGTYGDLPVPSRDGCLFDGWYTETTGGTKVVSTTPITNAINHILYAHWRDITMLILPASLKRIDDNAFLGCASMFVVIPEQCEYIGKKAFADNSELLYVIFPDAEMLIESDAFINCPNITFICYEDSSAHVFAEDRNLPYVLYQSGWVLAEDVPAGVRVIAEKWSYTRAITETKTSMATSMEGWEQTGFTWQKTGSGTHTYANYPAGFDTGHELYAKYAKSALSSSTTGNTKREVGASSIARYIYWHWTFTDVVYDTNRNVVIDDKKGYGVHISGSLYRDFIYFDAFETSLSLSPEGMSSGGLTTFDGVYSTYYYPDYNLPEYASWWWYRFEVYQQSYTDYQKLFSYKRTTFKEEESSLPVDVGGDISNVRHLIKYEF